MDQDTNYIDMTADYYFTEGSGVNMTVHDLNDIKNNNNINNLQLDKITIEHMVLLISNKNTEKIREILEMDKKDKKIINFVDDDNESLLHFSIFCNSYDLSRLFLKYGANPNKRNNEGTNTNV